jgi:hypothetical protein
MAQDLVLLARLRTGRLIRMLRMMVGHRPGTLPLALQIHMLMVDERQRGTHHQGLLILTRMEDERQTH